MPAHRNGRVAGNVVRSWALALGGALLLSVPLLGHHTFTRLPRRNTIEARRYRQFQYRNPHSGAIFS